VLLAALRVHPELEAAVPVQWMPNFLALPGYCKVAAAKELLLQHGLFAMDVASEVPVHALLASLCSGDGKTSIDGEVEVGRVQARAPVRVLDMCCAPGGKLLSLFDKLGSSDVIDGVDVAMHRLETCRAILCRNLDADSVGAAAGPTIRLFHCDGRVFGRKGTLEQNSLIFESSGYLDGHGKKGLPSNKSGRVREKRRLQKVLARVEETLDAEMGSYNYVLVDAECTHDGSYRHMKFVELENERALIAGLEVGTRGEGVEDMRKPSAAVHYHDSSRQSVCELQRELLSAGFRALQPGGELVYSTCSLEERQNEDVVRWFLGAEPTATLVPLDAYVRGSEVEVEKAGTVWAGDACNSGEEDNASKERLRANALLVHVCGLVGQAQGQPGSLQGTVQFDRRCGTSGLFVAKVRKRSAPSKESLGDK
jgi:16S rRNA C967 or C1407 C5-methylase (RsmB/RsmF family)